jgi:hypothetical protein
MTPHKMYPTYPQSNGHSRLTIQQRYARWPYYLPPDDWVVTNNEAPQHWSNLSPPDGWMAVHEGLFTRQTGRQGSDLIHALTTKDPLTRPGAHPLPFSEMPGAGTLARNGQSVTPSPFFAQVPSTGRRDVRFLLYRYAQYTTRGLSNIDYYYKLKFG